MTGEHRMAPPSGSAALTHADVAGTARLDALASEGVDLPPVSRAVVASVIATKSVVGSLVVLRISAGSEAGEECPIGVDDVEERADTVVREAAEPAGDPIPTLGSDCSRIRWARWTRVRGAS